MTAPSGARPNSRAGARDGPEGAPGRWGDGRGGLPPVPPSSSCSFANGVWEVWTLSQYEHLCMTTSFEKKRKEKERKKIYKRQDKTRKGKNRRCSMVRQVYTEVLEVQSPLRVKFVYSQPLRSNYLRHLAGVAE